MTLRQRAKRFQLRPRDGSKDLRSTNRAPTRLVGQNVCDHHRVGVVRTAQNHVARHDLTGTESSFQLCARAPNLVGARERKLTQLRRVCAARVHNGNNHARHYSPWATHVRKIRTPQ